MPGEVRRGSAARISLSGSSDEISITPSGVRTKTEKGRTSPTAAAEPDVTIYQPPERKKPVVLFALLGAILLALVIVIIVVTTGGSNLPTASLPPTGPAPGTAVATPTPTALPAAPLPVTAPPIPTAGSTTPAVADTAPPTVTPPTTTASVPTPPSHAGGGVIAPSPHTIRQPNRPVAVRPHPVPPTPTPAVAPPPAVKSCDPPYYFDGPKKVFKPECL